MKKGAFLFAYLKLMFYICIVKLKIYYKMSHTRVKTTYEEQGYFSSTEVITLYCHHNHSCDVTTFYWENGEVVTMVFQEWSRGNDLWDAMNRLWSPYKDKEQKELKDGVEYYGVAPWEK